MASWKEFFDSHAPHYMENKFTRNTVAEVDFVLGQLKLPPGSSILDVGCGTGRHSIEFARRDFRVTSIDISAQMLAEAEKAAKRANVTVEWVNADATQFKATRMFDAAVCLCEGAFGLLGLDDDPSEHDVRILHNIAAALKRGAGFILTTLNGFGKVRQINQDDVENNRFDLVTMVEVINEVDVPEGKRKVALKQKFYTPPELILLLHDAGFHVRHVWGGTAGEWGRRKINLDEIEFMIVTKKVER